MLLDVAPEMLESGLSVAALVARNIDNTRTLPELVAYRRAVGRRLAAYWKNRSTSANPVIREYHEVHKLFGAIGEPPAPEKLLTYVRRNRDFTSSGAVVDCYNIVSARTLLSIGAHDLNKLSLPITLRPVKSQDLFVPLGGTEPRSLNEGYAYVDSRGSVICCLDVLQCEQTKTTRESQEIVFFLQGNGCLPAAVVLKGAWLLSEIVKCFCGGTTELVSFLDADAIHPTASIKPPVSFENFKNLSLQKGTVTGAKRLSNLSALSAITVRTRQPIHALALSSALPDKVVGQQVIVATELHPLVVNGETFTSYLPALFGDAYSSSTLQLDAAIPDGERLY